MIIVDASVACQWVLPDSEEAAARAVLQGEELLIAPSVLRLEVTSAISRRFRDGSLTEKDAKIAASSLQTVIDSGAIQLIPMEDVWDVALCLSFKAKHAFADCLYLAAGKTMKQPVVTADQAMATRGKKAGVDVILLSDAAKRWSVA